MKTVDSYISHMIEAQASDLHLASGLPPMIRIHGKLEPLSLPRMTSEQVVAMAHELLDAPRTKELAEESHVDFVYDMGPNSQYMHRFRANAFLQKNGMNLVFRGIPSQIPSMEDLGLPDVLLQVTRHHHGLVLVVGPAGCGKTSTLAALVRFINETRYTHVITIEDPIEYIFENDRAMVIQRQVGDHVDSFATALRACLREDPDVIVVAEMRDLETIQMAITAAETGHLVLGTLHTRSAVQTVQRIVDSFPANQQSQIRTMLSDSLRGVICQQLMPRKDGNGRVVAYELLLTNGSICNLIREGKDFQLPNAMHMGRKQGLRMMDDSLAELVDRGLIDKHVAMEGAADPKGLAPRIGVVIQGAQA